MNTEIINKIAVIRNLLNDIESELSSINQSNDLKKFDPNKFIDDIFNNFVRKVDRVKYPNVAFFGFDVDGNYLFEYSEKNGRFWVSYSKIWSVLEKEMKWDCADIQKFMKTKVEEHFKLRDVTPYPVRCNQLLQVEEHFKLRDVTPAAGRTPLFHEVEEHFKLRDVTPSISIVLIPSPVEEHFKIKDISPQ